MMGTWLLAISITKAPPDVIHIGSHLIRYATSTEATGLGLYLISLRMSLSCLQHHLLHLCFFVKELWYAQLCLYDSCFLKGFLIVLPLITWIILFGELSKALQAKLVASLPPRYLSIILVILLLLLLVVMCSFFRR